MALRQIAISLYVFAIRLTMRSKCAYSAANTLKSARFTECADIKKPGAVKAPGSLFIVRGNLADQPATWGGAGLSGADRAP